METPKAKPRNGWPVWLDGDTIKILRDIQQNATMGVPSYAAIVRMWAQGSIAKKPLEPIK